MKKLFLGLLFLTMSVVLVACSSGPKGTYKGKLMGSDVTLKVDGKKGTMTGESSWLGETKEELTINAKEKKHTKISSEEISDGREYSLLFLCVKVEVSC